MLYVNLASCLNCVANVVHGAFYLFYSFSSTLPWNACKNSWNDGSCYEKDYRNVPCFRVNVTLARKYSSHNYTGKDALVIHTSSAGGGTVIVSGSEYDSMHSACVNGTQTSTEQFLLKKVLRLSSGIEEIGDLHPDMLLIISLCCLAELLSILKGVRGYAKTWRAASQQLLFSMGLALGTLTGYGSYKPFEWPLSMNIVQLVGADFCFSFFSGCMVFALYGHATVLYGLEFEDLVTADYDYAFVMFPGERQALPPPRAVVHRLLPTHVAFVEIGVSTFVDVYPSLKPHRLMCTVTTCTVMYILSLPAATGGGLYVLNLIDYVTYIDLGAVDRVG
ncbi:hypothetical protein MRX96_005855 [Rhipicephalus microplus]